MYAIFQYYRLVTLEKNYEAATELELKLKGSDIFEVNSLDELSTAMNCKREEHRKSMKLRFKELMFNLANARD